ncbi:MAG: ornithine carbamoyltransferase [Rhizobiales bacterium TMED28]|nr:ornithine carbamoyltransferase [Rhodobiaceae bacterium]OUT82089.1 MAG: ornithine carbamoyltransferase [Rhizobiales bacterium TMED28]|tara:strand:+ start:6894 stop:7814 length:921 start_codon:yes stop_codon:yes gene_type:complete
MMESLSRNFINLHESEKANLTEILSLGEKMKANRNSFQDILDNKSFILLFDKPSTRTRISFELAISELGGSCIFLDMGTSQLGRGESIKDTAKVLSRYVDGLIIRNANHQELIEFSEHSSISIINALTNESHPCQIMADLMTLKECFGSIDDLNIAWIGDGNNVANTWIQASTLFNFKLNMAIPSEYMPSQTILDMAKQKKSKINISQNIDDVIKDANCIVTDTWFSMNDDENEKSEKIRILNQYQVNSDLLEKAPVDAIFLHCLPAHRGQEVTDDVIDCDKSFVYQQAENRLHIQKAILRHCITG